MATILAVGIATLDIINTVENYPFEDSETRAIHQHQSRGGNATNTLTVLSQLGHNCHWAGVLVGETDSQIITQSLASHNIDTSACKTLPNGKMPTSYITHNQHNGSRTIVHYRDCPEYDFERFQQIDLHQYDWIHFEGRNVGETRQMLTHLKQQYPNINCSLEVEKHRPDIESLLLLPDWLFFSKDYAISQQQNTAGSFLKHMTTKTPLSATCTWGREGAWLINDNRSLTHQPVINNAKIIDTLGAGDTFNAGFIHGLLTGQSPQNSLSYATQLASHKCTQFGLESIIDNLTIKA